MVTAWNAWERWNNKQGFRRSLSQFSQVEKDAFRPMRPYVRGAGEYYILMRVINSANHSITNQKDFDELRHEWESKLKPFKEIFFIERNRLRKENIDSWIALHDVYDEVIKVMQNLLFQRRLLIATMKDGKSVKIILKKNGIDIPQQNIMDQSQISSKLEALNYFVKNKKIKKRELCFIDDNITHLIEPNNVNYNVFLSGWGNTMEEHKEQARKENIPIMEIINGRSF